MPEAVAKPSQTVEVTAWNVAFVPVSVVIVPLVAVRLLVNSFVVVTEVPVPCVNVRVPSVVPPTTVNVLVTVDEAPMKPPYNWRVVGVKEPRALTVASVSASAGQLVPLCKQTS